ncbi:MAG TPA: AMP-binding protein [Candidatus Dormibacteraeota bacterium]|nr:AMP-binding protein [Candidatus Dormibacteraeota bacterium]
MTTLPGLLARSALKYPDRPALRVPAQGVDWTWGELAGRARSAAAALLAAGVGPGDRVAVVAGNTAEFVVAFYGAQMAGAAVVPASPRLTAPEVAYVLGHSGCRVGVVAPEAAAVAAEAAAGLPVRLLDAGELPATVPDGAPALPTLMAEADAEILYTSGTTGRAKGVVMTHAGAVEAAAMAAYEFGFRVGERVAILMPLTHSAPLNLFLAGAAYTGSTVVLGAFNPREPAAMLEWLAAERANYLFAAPVAYLLGLRADPASHDLSHMRRWIYGGAPMAPAQVEAVRQAYGGSWMGVYGLTETGPNGTALAPEEHDQHAGSLGWRATVNTVLRLLDADGRDVPPGEPGEIVLRTPSAMRGYLDDPAASAQTLRDGWVWTGDMARRDEHGYLWMLDRRRDIVLSGGVNVYPKEVEDAIAGHPAVADVAVVGTPHPEWGETVCAVVVLRPGGQLTLAELRQFLGDRLTSQKHPRRLEVVAEVPRNATGKALRHVLRERLGG